MQNLEFKARLADFDKAECAAGSLGAEDHGWLEQEDTYFVAPRGRLKLRRENGAPEGQLVVYSRSDEPKARLCDYDVIPVPDANRMRRALEATLGVRAIVRKRRRLFLWKSIRIHLDRVEELGDFLELEAVLDATTTLGDARRDVEFLKSRLGVAEAHMLSLSYVDMMESLRGGISRPPYARMDP